MKGNLKHLDYSPSLIHKGKPFQPVHTIGSKSYQNVQNDRCWFLGYTDSYKLAGKPTSNTGYTCCCSLEAAVQLVVAVTTFREIWPLLPPSSNKCTYIEWCGAIKKTSLELGSSTELALLAQKLFKCCFNLLSII